MRDPFFSLPYEPRDDNLVCVWPLITPPSEHELCRIQQISGPQLLSLSPAQVLAVMDVAGSA